MTGALIHNLLLFGDLLKRAGLGSHAGKMPNAVTAMEAVGVTSRGDVRAALRTLLVHRHEDVARFDAAFDLFWRAHESGGGGLPLFSLGERPRVVVKPAGNVTLESAAADAGTAAGRIRLAVGAYSPADVSRTKDFADFSPGELARAEIVLRDLGWDLARRRTRRWRPSSRGAADLRRIVARNLKHGGELVDVPRRARVLKPRPLVVMADVSGSMERYSRMLLHFIAGVMRGTARVESFVFATRLTRLTRAARDRRFGSSALRMIRDVQDWGGGTRIGKALRAFNVRWARRVMRNGPVVLIVSDGWDRGEPSLLTREIARLRRSSRRLIWLNPLLGSESYEPLTRGMQAALPHIDDFMPAHNLQSLEQLATHLRAIRRGHAVAPAFRPAAGQG
jgi:uncharacterized protein with von Willebrand factor type A (vWA) domain